MWLVLYMWWGECKICGKNSKSLSSENMVGDEVVVIPITDSPVWVMALFTKKRPMTMTTITGNAKGSTMDEREYNRDDSACAPDSCI